MAKKRIKYNYLFIIQDLGWTELFDQFVEDSNLEKHLKGKKPLSKNRLACAFVRRAWKNLGLPKNSYKAPCYVVGHEVNYDRYVDELI